MPIISVSDHAADITIFTVTDTPPFEEFMDALRSFYENNPTRKVIWKLNQNSVWDLSGEALQNLAQYIPTVEKSRAGGKTAFVASDKLSKSIAELFIQLGRSEKMKLETKIFKSETEALKWLGIVTK